MRCSSPSDRAKGRETARSWVCAFKQNPHSAAHSCNFYGLTGNDVLSQLAHQRVTAMNQQQSSHVYRAFVVRNHHGQEVMIRIARKTGSVHVVHHARHAFVHVNLKLIACGGVR